MKHMTIFDHLIGALGIALLVFALALAGCEKASGPALTSECRFEEVLAVNIVAYNTEGELRRYWESVNPGQELPKDATVKGLATYNTRTKVHTLHVMAIRGQNDHDRIETIGHELMHSFCGEWHPPNSY